MPKVTVPFHASLSARMLLLGVLPTAAILLGIIVWLALFTVRELRAANEHEMQILADRVAAEIERGNTRAVLIAQVMAEAQENGLFGRRAESVAYAREVLASYPELTGAYFGYEPNADGADAGAAGREPEIAAALAGDGRFIPYWFRDKQDNRTLRLEPLVDMETSLYYQGCKDLFREAGGPRAMVTEPYVYEGKMIVEQTYPIVVDGRFVGIAGVDRALSDIETFLQDIKARDGVEVYLVSRAGKFVAATTENSAGGEGAPVVALRTEMVSESPYAELFGPFLENRAEPSFQLATDPIDGERHYFASAPVPTGRWMVVIRKAESSVLAPIRERVAPIFAIVVLGLLAVAGISMWVTRSTSARIGRVVDAADRMALGDATLAGTLDTEGRDETARLNASFERLAESYQAITRICVAIAEGDFSRTFPKRSEHDQLAVALNEMSERRRRAEEDVRRSRDLAEEANRAKSEFLAKMSHELRTPMNAIIGYSEMLEEEAEETDQQAFVPDLRKIQSAGKHLLALINDILDLSKIEAGKMDLYLEEFDVGEMVDDVSATIRPLADKNDNRLEVVRGEDLGRMRSDLVKVRQGLFNLLSNACKFTSEGTVALRVRRVAADRGDRLVFEVSDSGIGMSEEELGRIFEAFGQADGSTTRRFGGTGLGLTITRRFCEMMGGSVSVESEKGVGSTFTIELPAEVEEAATAESPAEAGGGPRIEGPEAGPLVLVVDDDASARDLLCRIVSREGYRVVAASSGEEGLALARELRPVAVTLDVMMPGLDGWEVLNRLKADPATADLPVLMCTILRDESMAFALGASEFLTKPVDKGRLLSVLAHCGVGSERTALVVEDDDDSRELVVRLLEQDGWRVRTARNGREGLDRVAEERPGVVLLDLMMPVMDGFEFLHGLRAEEAWRDLPVIVVTAKQLTSEERQFLEDSAQRVVAKGAGSSDELTDLLRDLVDRSASG